MHTIVYILAAFGLITLVVVTYLVFKFVYPLLKSLKEIKEVTGLGLKDFMGDSILSKLSEELDSLEMSVEKYQDYEWGKPEEINAEIATFKGLGFKPAGVYTNIFQFGEAEVLVNNGKILLIGEKENNESIQTRLLGKTENNNLITISKNTNNRVLPQFTNETNIELQSASPERVLEEFDSLLGGRHLAMIDLDNIKKELNSLNDYFASDLVRHPERIEEALAEDESGDNFYMNSVISTYSNLVSKCCRKEYLRSSNLSAEEWEELREHLIVIHDYTIKSNVVENNEDNYDNIKETFKNSAEKITRANYQSYLNNLEPEKRPTFLKSIESPIAADFYKSDIPVYYE